MTGSSRGRVGPQSTIVGERGVASNLSCQDDHMISVQSRISPEVAAGHARLGVLGDPLPEYDYHVGTCRVSRRAADGVLHGSTGPRRGGAAAGYQERRNPTCG